MAELTLSLACPACYAPLETRRQNCLVCPTDGREYLSQDGIWRCLLPERIRFYNRFLDEYETVRTAERRGSQNPAYYHHLPFAPSSDLYHADWQLRARSFIALLGHVIGPMEKQITMPLNILDLGAGNGWLSHRLAERGHRLAAIDLRCSTLDGLGAIRYYPLPVTAVQAEFDHLPFLSGDINLAIFNASLHYSTDYSTTLREVLRVITREGCLAIVDTPVYRQAESGQAMVAERQERFLSLYGFRSDAIPCQNFLTPAQLSQLAVELNLEWRFFQPNSGVRWMLHRWKAHLRLKREPANFPIIVGKRIL